MWWVECPTHFDAPENIYSMGKRWVVRCVEGKSRDVRWLPLSTFPMIIRPQKLPSSSDPQEEKKLCTSRNQNVTLGGGRWWEEGKEKKRRRGRKKSIPPSLLFPSSLFLVKTSSSDWLRVQFGSCCYSGQHKITTEERRRGMRRPTDERKEGRNQREVKREWGGWVVWEGMMMKRNILWRVERESLEFFPNILMVLLPHSEDLDRDDGDADVSGGVWNPDREKKKGRHGERKTFLLPSTQIFFASSLLREDLMLASLH